MARRAQERPELNLKSDLLVKQSVAEKIADSLRDAILSNVLKGGTALIEKQLAEEFQVSKTPVREALLRLAQTGLVDFAHARGATVHQLSFKEMQDILEMRQTLEPLALTQSAPNLNKTDLKQLSKTLESAQKAQESGQFSKLSELNNSFHNLLYSKAENQLLLIWLSSLNDRRRLISVKGWLSDNRSAEELNEHEAILSALQAQDYTQAVHLLEDHIKTFSYLVLNHHPLAKEAA